MLGLRPNFYECIYGFPPISVTLQTAHRNLSNLEACYTLEGLSMVRFFAKNPDLHPADWVLQLASLTTQFCSSPTQSSPSSVCEANFSISPRCSEMNCPRSSTRVTALITSQTRHVACTLETCEAYCVTSNSTPASPMMILWTTAPIKNVRTTYRISPVPKPTIGIAFFSMSALHCI